MSAAPDVMTSNDDTTRPITLEPAPDAYRVLFRQVIMVRAVIGFIVAGVVFVGAAALQYNELRQKPSADDMRESITNAVAPLRERSSDIDARVGKIESSMGRMQRVLRYQVEQSAWQSQVLDHIATRRRGAPPRKPARLLDLERELIQK